MNDRLFKFVFLGVAGVALIFGLLLLVSSGDEDEAPPADATAGTSAFVDESFEYPNLDGEMVTIGESQTTAFTDGRPTPISVIDLSFENVGCDGVQGELDFWLDQLDDADLGERASVYAQYALDLGAENGCDLSR